LENPFLFLGKKVLPVFAGLYRSSVENILMIQFPTEDTERKNHREHRGNNLLYNFNSELVLNPQN